MEARVKVLEEGQRTLLDGQRVLLEGQKSTTDALKDLKDALEKLRESQQKAVVELAELKGRVSQLPSTLQMIGFVVLVLGIAGVSRWLGR